jgi:topoisomerase IA-like protein
MKEWFEYQTWVHPDTNETRLVGPQTEAILYVFFDIPCFFSRAELENFLGVKALNHNVGSALLKMVEAKMIIKTKDKINTEQFYLGHFGMEALQRSTIPDINNRPNNFMESITLRTENGLQLINERAAKKRDSLAAKGNQLTNDRAATKKCDSPAKTSTKITPQQKRKKMKCTPA